MMRILKANLKAFVGARYERIPKTLVRGAIVFLALCAAEIRLEIAPFVLGLTTFGLTISSFVSVLSSDATASSVRGQMMLPTRPAQFHGAFFLSILFYTLLTKAGLLLIAYLAISPISTSAIVGFALCFIGGGVFAYPLAFRFEKKTTASCLTGRARHNFMIYLVRYLQNNKNYLINTLALWVFGCVFALFMSTVDFPHIALLGLAIMCLNTPLGILLSSDRALYRQAFFLPCQAKGILFPYAFFLAAVNIIASAVYLCAWHLVTGNITPIMIAAAVLFSATSAALTVLFEVKFPLLNWKVESDLWHHPRKYLVPGIMVVLASVSIVLIEGF